MKYTIKLISVFIITASFWACTNDDIVVRYPVSIPMIDTAIVAESVITYGDSIHLKVAVSDKVAPLSTALVRVVVNNDIVASEVIRTKGNESSFTRVFHVPFVANRPNNAPVKIYLTTTNVTGIEKDSIISTTIAKRPVIKNYYLVPDFGTGSTVKLTPENTDSILWKATGLSLAKTLKFKIATKVDRFNRVDWTGLVFGKVGDGIGLIDQTGESFEVSDGTLIGISSFTFDALMFKATIGGKLLEPVTTLDVIADLPANPASLINNTNFRGGNVYFGENVEVTFSGLSGDIANNVSPDYFEKTGTNKAKFLGKTGLYKAYYLTTANFVYIEPQPETLYPDVLWVCGTGYGRPSSPYETTSSWNWNSPLDYYPARLVSPGVYQVTMYCKNSPSTDTNIYGKLDFKFFHKRGWWDGHETWVNDYSVQAPFLGPPNVNGNVKVMSATVVEGVFKFTLDTNNKTLTYQKLN